MSAEHFLNGEFRARRLKKADVQAYAKLTGCDPIEAAQRLVDLNIDGSSIAQYRSSFSISKGSWWGRPSKHGMRNGMSRIDAAKAILREKLT